MAAPHLNRTMMSHLTQEVMAAPHLNRTMMFHPSQEVMAAPYLNRTMMYQEIVSRVVRVVKTGEIFMTYRLHIQTTIVHHVTRCQK